MSNNLSLLGEKVSATYQRIVQVSEGKFYNGIGEEIVIPNIILTGEGYLSLTSDKELKALPINLSTSNITGKLPFNNIVQINSLRLIGNSTDSLNNLNEISLGQGLLFIGNTLHIEQSLLNSSLNCFNETPNGVKDNINTIYTTINNYNNNTTRLYFNGQRLKLGSDYNETNSNEITLLFSPIETDTLIIDYSF